MLRRIVRWSILGIVAIVLAGLAGMLIPRPLFGRLDVVADTGQPRQILVLSNPIHTDLALPVDAETLAYFPFLAEAGFPVLNMQARWIIFGWGGRSFYLETPHWSDLKAVPVFKSFSLDSSVMHVEVAGEFPDGDPTIRKLSLSPDAYRNLVSAIAMSFAMEQGKPKIIPGYSYGDGDRFFEANGYFNAVMGCNTWTAAMLRRGGLRTGWWNPLPFSLNQSLSLFNG